MLDRLAMFIIIDVVTIDKNVEPKYTKKKVFITLSSVFKLRPRRCTNKV
jgi:hypothetical protein